jgi:hypothetical protein
VTNQNVGSIDDPGDDAAPTNSMIFELTGRQRELLLALSKESPKLGDLYLGAIVTLPRNDNPDRFAQACLSLRELMDKLPEWLPSLPTRKKPVPMGTKVRDFADSWAVTRTKSKCRVAAVWSGPIDGHLEKGLARVDDLVTWVHEEFPARRAQTTKLLQHLDPNAVPLPENIEERRAKQWMDAYEFFNKVAHHNVPEPNEVEIARFLLFLESFLLEVFRPKTFDKLKTLDQIIARGEARANS